MMKLAIMQPYFFPYIGYFQLIAAVDKFVFYDDVNFIKNGWINRNQLLMKGAAHYFTVPLSDASSFKKINQIAMQESVVWRRKMVELVRYAYSKAPYFTVVNDLFSAVLFSKETHIAELAKSSVVSISTYLELNTQFVVSSTVYHDAELSGIERVIDICKKENADQYYNLPGGRTLYDEDVFAKCGIELHFISPCQRKYPQFSGKFQAGLSMIDTLMFNGPCAVREMLHAEGRQ